LSRAWRSLKKQGSKSAAIDCKAILCALAHASIEVLLQGAERQARSICLGAT